MAADKINQSHAKFEEEAPEKLCLQERDEWTISIKSKPTFPLSHIPSEAEEGNH